MNRCCCHGFVRGRVQGVYFRRFTADQAHANNVTGWARNLPDGRVEFLLCGTSDDVQRLLTALGIGPPMASVTSIEEEKLPWRDLNGFSIS